MSGRMSKKARGYAYKEAARQGLWKKGEKDVYSKWWRKLLARFFPKVRKRYTDAIGRWYKSILKRWAKEAYASIHDPDRVEFERVRNKLRKQEYRARLKRTEKV